MSTLILPSFDLHFTFIDLDLPSLTLIWPLFYLHWPLLAFIDLNFPFIWPWFDLYFTFIELHWPSLCLHLTSLTLILSSFDLVWPLFYLHLIPIKWPFQKWIKQKWEDSDFMNSTEEEQWNKITKMFDAIGIDIESVFNHIESLLGVKVQQNPSISP